MRYSLLQYPETMKICDSFLCFTQCFRDFRCIYYQKVETLFKLLKTSKFVRTDDIAILPP